jgi:hypothetical protein
MSILCILLACFAALIVGTSDFPPLDSSSGSKVRPRGASLGNNTTVLGDPKFGTKKAKAQRFSSLSKIGSGLRGADARSNRSRTRRTSQVTPSCDWQEGLDGHYEKVSGDWKIDPAHGCQSSDTVLLPLNQAVEALRLKQGASDDMRFYALGDSVLRTCIATILKLNTAAVKEECGKSNVIDRAASCVLRGNRTVAHFNWLQWLSTPSISSSSSSSSSSADANKMRACATQATDFCHSYSITGELIGSRNASQSRIDACLAAFFHDAKSTDFLIIRAGLQYALFDSVWSEYTNCQKIPNARNELSLALQTFPDKLKRAFPGKVIWWMLSPLAPPNSSGVRCGPPLSEMSSSSILALNDEIEKAAKAAGFAVLSKPEKYLIGQDHGKVNDKNIGGYFDCIHFRKPGCLTTFTLLFNIVLRMMGTNL